MPNSNYKKGWAASKRGSVTALERADARGESKDWYDGYMDHACGRLFGETVGPDLMEDAYACVTDELNDGSPNQITLGDLNPVIVARAERWANDHNLNWPPQTGDFDNYYLSKLSTRQNKETT